jgi:lysozyme
MDLVLGIDVSAWEPRIDWHAAYQHGVRFAFIRATSSVDYVDPTFRSHWGGACEVGILRGAFHYLVAKKPGKDQAKLFLDTVGADQGELPPVVDLEDKYNEDATPAQLRNTCEAFLSEIAPAFKHKPMIYSRRSFLQPRLLLNGKPPAWAKNYWLWLAQYPYEFYASFMPNNNMPQQPAGWVDWTFWQYSEKGEVSGITDKEGRPTGCDLDWFRGTEKQLYDFAGYQQPVPPPVPPTPKPETYVVKQGESLKSIADLHGLSLVELLEANPSVVQPGTNLNIPKRAPQPPPHLDPRPPQPPPAPPTTRPTIQYIVRSTDNLSTLAQRNKTKIEAIMALNPQVTNANIIITGDTLIIPVGWF